MTLADTHQSPARPRGVWDEIVAPLPALPKLGREAKIALVVLAVLALWGVAILTFGVPALVWPMKLVVPGIVLGLVLLTWGM